MCKVSRKELKDDESQKECYCRGVPDAVVKDGLHCQGYECLTCQHYDREPRDVEQPPAVGAYIRRVPPR